MRKITEFFQNLIPVSSGPLIFSRKPLEHNIVAHALGEWNGENYLNCQEAFETNYQKGVRLFETDISVTKDGKVVLFHDGHEERFGLKKDFTEAEFLKAKPFGATLLNLEMLGKLLLKFPDARIITDIKDDNLKILQELVTTFENQGVDARKAVIPQIYNPYEFSEIKKLNFDQYIFTVYRFRKKQNILGRFLKKHPEISALTVPDKWVESKNYLPLAKKVQIDVFVHSINKTNRRDELISKGVTGVYTPNLF